MIKAIWGFLTFKKWRDAREALKRRKRYDQIKADIVSWHMRGYGGFVLDQKKFDLKDLESFKPPMYQIARTAKNAPIITWRKDLMTEEVGSPKGEQDGKPAEGKIHPATATTAASESTSVVLVPN